MKKIRKYIFLAFVIIAGLRALPTSAQHGYSFFSDKDIAIMKQVSQTDRGKQILDSLNREIDDRLRHPMEVPMLEGGHSHHYFCPEHNIRFTFDWNKPTSHYCKLCQKEWKQVKFNWAWINILHNRNHEFLNACTYLYLTTGNKKYAEYIKDLLFDYALKYPTYMLHNTHRQQTGHQNGKMYGQSLDEAVFASYAARAYRVAKPIMSEREIERIETGYLKPCAVLLMRQKSGGNWQVWHNSGIASLGVALGNDSIINVALNNPERGHYRLMELHVRKDGWWDEGSPTYHFYPLQAMILTADAVRCRNINLYDDTLRRMISTPALAAYCNLQFPSHNDGWYGQSLITQANLYEIASMRLDDEAPAKVLRTIYVQTGRTAIESLQNDKDFSDDIRIADNKSVNFPHTGFAILRSGEKSVVLKYGPHGGNHGHPDKLSISIHDGRKEIISDLGTSAYGVPDYRQWYKNTLSHSTLTVDFVNQQPTEGTLIRFEPNTDGGTIEASSGKAYEGVAMNRSLTLKGNCLTDVFTAISGMEHVYDYVLILTEEPVFRKEAKDAALNDADIYRKIKNTRRIDVRKSIAFTTGGSEVIIESLEASGFELYWGEAPGIPTRNSEPQTWEESKSYPLIIRLKNNRMKIKTIWKIKN